MGQKVQGYRAGSGGCQALCLGTASPPAHPVWSWAAVLLLMALSLGAVIQCCFDKEGWLQIRVAWGKPQRS